MDQISSPGSEAGRATRPAEVLPLSDTPTVLVWDRFIRVFHWSLVALFATAFLTRDTSEAIHVSAGYGIFSLVVLRIVWGFIGSTYARFNDFVYRPTIALRYLADAMRFRAKRYIGHNPAGGAMVLAFLVGLTTTTVSGHLMTTALWGQKWIEQVHEVSAYACLALVGLHVLGVVFACFEHRENLVKSMLTGRKVPRRDAS